MKSLPKDDPRVAWPLYTLREAARYLEMPSATLYRWARGYRGHDPLISVLPASRHEPTMSFAGFAEAFVIHAALKAGVRSDRIRPGVQGIRDSFPSLEYALANQRVYTDRVELLVRFLDEDENELEVARTRQRQFTKTVADQLRCITYADDGFARRLRLPQYQGAKVIIDPLVASGQPLLAKGTAPRVEDIVGRHLGGDSVTTISKAFAIPPNEVEAVLTRHTQAA